MTLIPTVLPSDEARIPRDAFWMAGFDDGQVGQTWLEHERILRVDAERERADEIAECEQRVERAKADGEIANGVHAREQERYERVAEQYRKAAEDREKNPSQYSRAMSIIFILLAVAILGADYPLSQAISKEIIQETGLESWFIAGGIVAMGLFFKIVADSFMTPRYLLHPVVRPFTWIVTAILAVIIAVTLSAVLVLLGIFRGDTLKKTESTDTTFSAPVTTTATTTASSTAPKPSSGVGATLQGAFSLEPSLVAKVAFLALGLLLPILGGIFASTGTARWHNHEQLKRLHARYDESHAAYEAVVRQMHEQSARLRTAEGELNSLKSRTTLVGNRYHTYLHGYERGLCDPAAVEGNISDAVVAFVRRWLTIARQRENLLRTEAIARANGGAAQSNQPKAA